MRGPGSEDLIRRCASPAETGALAAALGAAARPGDFLALVGPLGAGKTHLTKGIAEGLGIDPDNVTSPTFTIHKCYEGRCHLDHLDFYLERFEERVWLKRSNHEPPRNTRSRPWRGPMGFATSGPVR